MHIKISIYRNIKKKILFNWKLVKIDSKIQEKVIKSSVHYLKIQALKNLWFETVWRKLKNVFMEISSNSISNSSAIFRQLFYFESSITRTLSFKFKTFLLEADI